MRHDPGPGSQRPFEADPIELPAFLAPPPPISPVDKSGVATMARRLKSDKFLHKS
jgi:hypothetical protein